MSNGVRGYLAGVCHGVAVCWIAGYVLYKSGVQFADLFGPQGTMPVVLALTVAVMANPILMYRRRPRAGADEPNRESRVVSR